MQTTKPERGAIMYQLMNYEKNQKLLKHLAHIHYLDMAIVFYYWQGDAPGEGAGLISKSNMKQWGYTLTDLEQIATYNTPRKMPVSFHSMEEMIQELLGDVPDIMKDEKPEIPMHILTNQDKLFGAASILYPQVLWAVSESLNSDLYILPSSIHECIIVPSTVKCTREELEEIVQDINSTIVAPEEILSNRVFLYRKEEDCIRL